MIKNGPCLNRKYVQQIVDFIRERITILPTVGIVCGSGFGKMASKMKNAQVLKYEDIPNFPRSTVVGHPGNLVFGEFGGKMVVVMQGRFHMYEGYERQHVSSTFQIYVFYQITIPIRVMKLLGVEILLLTNAAGGLNRSLKVGDLVCIKDHISFPGMSLNNVLVGPNDEDFGERFIAISDAYDSNLRSIFKKVVAEMNFSDVVKEGVYAHVGGPTYESPAECRMLLMIGADVVGMSTAPEVLVARHAGIRVFALSLVTNVSVLDEESKE
ncbi:hypothetical protein T265_15960, partial [Opisthorchis viverrini]